MKIKEIFKNREQMISKEIETSGWIRFKRVSSKIIFIDLIDGTKLSGIQLIVKKDIVGEEEFEKISKISLFSSIKVSGKILEGKNDIELVVNKVNNVFMAEEDYTLGKKEHTLEYLRERAELRSRTKLFQAVMKLRSALAISVHEFFASREFLYFHSPIITSNDAEGAGESFYVKDGNNKNFFSNNASLTVSGQLHAESYAQSFGAVYTFGPTFRAENSNTTKHASEFWMIEPEATFYDYKDMMNLGEGLLKFISKEMLDKYEEELKFLSEYNKVDLIEVLTNVVQKDFKRISYTDALEYLKNEIKIGNVSFENNDIEFGLDLATEHEKYLSQTLGEGPIYVYDYPKDIKSFYMYQNDDGKTVRGFDLLVPMIGELIGGSQREEDYDKLIRNSKEKGIDISEIEWYANLRRSGYATSSGFGIGFERLVMFVTGVENIRDVIPFPRTPGKVRF